MLTITRDHLDNLPQVIDHYVEMGFNGIFLRALNPYGYAVKNSDKLGYSTEEFVTSYKSALDHIINLNFAGTPFTEYYATLLLQRILTPFSTGFVDLQSPAGAGISGVIYDYKLRDLGYECESLGIRDAKTVAAIQSFQGNFGLESNGIINLVTKQKFDTLNLIDIQKKLKLLRYDVDANGIRDLKTVKAIKDFQQASGLSANGIIDEKTQMALGI